MSKRPKSNKLIIAKGLTNRGAFFSYAMAHAVFEYEQDPKDWYNKFCKKVKDQAYGLSSGDYSNIEQLNPAVGLIKRHMAAKFVRSLMNQEVPDKKYKLAIYEMLVRIVAGEEPNKVFDYRPKRGKRFIFDQVLGSKAVCHYYLLSKKDQSEGAVIDTAEKFSVAKKTVEDYLHEFRLADDVPAAVLKKFSEVDILYDVGRLDPFTLLNWRN